VYDRITQFLCGLLSSFFVSQGGFLSPLWFALYVDDLIILLKNSGYGCVVNGFYCGCVFYADDVLLMASSLAHLEIMLKLCSQYADKWGLQFNAKKSNVSVVGPHFKSYRDACQTHLGSGVITGLLTESILVSL